MRKAYSITLVALLVAVGLFPGLGETAMVKLSLERLTQEADAVVLGTVTKQVSAWNDQRTAIHTDVTVAVEEVIKGAAGAEVTFRVAGGTVGDLGMRTSTDPVFQDGERVIVFLRTATSPGQLPGLQQGKFTVSNGTVKQDGRTVTVADFINGIRAASR